MAIGRGVPGAGSDGAVTEKSPADLVKDAIQALHSNYRAKPELWDYKGNRELWATDYLLGVVDKCGVPVKLVRRALTFNPKELLHELTGQMRIAQAEQAAAGLLGRFVGQGVRVSSVVINDVSLTSDDLTEARAAAKRRREYEGDEANVPEVVALVSYVGVPDVIDKVGVGLLSVAAEEVMAASRRYMEIREILTPVRPLEF